MKKIFFVMTLAIGIFAFAAEVRDQKQTVPVIAPSPDLPPPACWPNCGPVS